MQLTELTWKDNTYKGQLDSSNRPHGKGTLEYKSNGCVYQGEFKEGRRHGLGKITHPKGIVVYHGQFIDGKQEYSNMKPCVPDDA